MKTYATYGFYVALGGFLLNLALFFTGFHADAAKLASVQWVGMVVFPVIGIAFMVLGTNARKAQVPASEEFGYGKAFAAAFMITLFSCLFALVFTPLYFFVINPNVTEIMVQMQLDKLEAKGISGQQLEGAEKMTRMFMTNPAIFTGLGFIGGLFWGTLFALIVAIFTKRKASDEAMPPAMPTSA